MTHDCSYTRNFYTVVLLLVVLFINGCMEEITDTLSPCTGKEHCDGVPLSGIYSELLGKWELYSLWSLHGYEGDDLIYRHFLEFTHDGEFIILDDNGIIQAGCVTNIFRVNEEDTSGINYASEFSYSCANQEYFNGNYSIRRRDDFLFLTGYFIWSHTPNNNTYIRYMKIN